MGFGVDMTAFDKAWEVVKIQDADGRTRCVHCDRAYADMEVKPEPGESWADGCPWCYADIAEEEDRRSRPNPGVEEVRDLVQQGMEVMPAVREVARLLGVDGRKLMGAYVRAYR